MKPKSGSSYDVWNSMVTSENYSDPSDSQAYRTTAMFLGYIDKQIGTYYGYNYSPDMNTYINVLKNQTGKNYTLEDVAEEKIESILSKYQPILCTSVRYVLNPTSGSTESQYPAQFIIDYGRKHTHHNIKYQVYESVLQASDPAQWDNNTTYEELIEHYGAGNVIRIEKTSSELFLKINWGMGGLYNDVEINAHAASWDLEGESETLKHNAVKLIYPVK